MCPFTCSTYLSNIILGQPCTWSFKMVLLYDWHYRLVKSSRNYRVLIKSTFLADSFVVYGKKWESPFYIRRITQRRKWLRMRVLLDKMSALLYTFHTILYTILWTIYSHPCLVLEVLSFNMALNVWFTWNVVQVSLIGL